jgi:hypothetical protein
LNEVLQLAAKQDEQVLGSGCSRKNQLHQCREAASICKGGSSPMTSSSQ